MVVTFRLRFQPDLVVERSPANLLKKVKIGPMGSLTSPSPPPFLQDFPQQCLATADDPLLSKAPVVTALARCCSSGLSIRRADAGLGFYHQRLVRGQHDPVVGRQRPEGLCPSSSFRPPFLARLQALAAVLFGPGQFSRAEGRQADVGDQGPAKHASVTFDCGVEGVDVSL
ncbi:hypothetical protein PG985_008590 [Apiospora marii]|uniref:Uncharacterized protein n=1 Tax=Apiospora marii TaxID=335849 RepID=A0ABR1R2W0_9PEZI